MKQINQTTKKCKFEKPQIYDAEFVVCGLGILVAKIPAAMAISAACNVPGVLAAIPTAGIY